MFPHVMKDLVDLIAYDFSGLAYIFEVDGNVCCTQLISDVKVVSSPQGSG